MKKKKRWIIYTPQTSYLRRRIDRYSLGIVGGLIAIVFLIAVFILFFDKFLWTGFISVSLAAVCVIIAVIIAITLYKSYKL